MGAFGDDDAGSNSGSAYVFVPDPVKLITDLIQNVIDLNLPNGLKNGLTAKLDAAKDKLEDGNPNNDHVAVNKLNDFIDQVEGQRGKKITEADADELIGDAQLIIDLLEAELEPAI